MAQLSYSLDQLNAFAGLKAHSTSPTQVLSYIAEGAVGIGKAVMLGTNPDRQVMAPATDTNFLGVAIHDQARESQRNANDPEYQDKETVSTMTKGAVWVKCTDAVTAGAAAHYDTVSGDFVPALGTNASTAAVGSFQTSASAGGLAVLNLSVMTK